MSTREDSIAFIAPEIMDMFSGHVSKDVVIVKRYEPHELPWLPRAMITILLFPGDREGEGRCGVVNLLHFSERNTPRCGSPDCRCMIGHSMSHSNGVA